MNSLFKQTAFFACILITLATQAQVRVGGGISIDINLPLPEVVVIGRRPAPRPVPRRVPQPVPTPVPVPAPRPVPNVYALGTINNQNRPDGQIVYQVVNASVSLGRNYTENVFFGLDNGETLELVISTANQNDTNYNFDARGANPYNNTIVAAFLNNAPLPLHSGHIHLQPQGGPHFSANVNLQSVYDGNFNGSVNF